jgi:ribonucleotide reductase beta subunit family protein with ferritin-like domain
MVVLERQDVNVYERVIKNNTDIPEDRLRDFLCDNLQDDSLAELRDNIFKDDEDLTKYSYFPIRHKHLESCYKGLLNSFWTVGHLKLEAAKERKEWDDLDVPTRNFVKMLLFLFAQLDGIVAENLIKNFKEETSHIKECCYFYAIQEVNENIHNETYSTLIDIYIRDTKEKELGFNSIKNFESIRVIAAWTKKWMDPSLPLLERVVAFACVEGILFSSAFAGIYWIKRRNILQGLTLANEWIARDEGSHTAWAVTLYWFFVNELGYEPIPLERLYEIISSSVKVGVFFNKDAMKLETVGINIEDMTCYIKCTADSLIHSFGGEKLYKVNNKFDWMAVISLPNKSNFFEKTVTEYSKVDDIMEEFSMDEEF